MIGNEKNSAHFVPRFLQKAWHIKSKPGYVWTFEAAHPRAQYVIENRSTKSLLADEADKAANDEWNVLVETPAAAGIAKVREQPTVGGPASGVWVSPPPSMTEAEISALYHFIFSLRSRWPDLPSAWGGPTEAECLAVRKDPKANHEFLRDVTNKYHIHQLTLGRDYPLKLALAETAVFPVAVERLPVHVLPIAPNRAVLLAHKRLRKAELGKAFSELNIGAVSEAAPAMKLILAPGCRTYDDRSTHADLVEQVLANIRQWKPYILGHWRNQLNETQQRELVEKARSVASRR